MQFFAAASDRRDEVRRLQHVQVLGDGLPRHVQVFAEFVQRAAIMGMQKVQQLSPTRIGERPEELVSVVAVGHINTQALACLLIIGKHALACQAAIGEATRLMLRRVALANLPLPYRALSATTPHRFTGKQRAAVVYTSDGDPLDERSRTTQPERRSAKERRSRMPAQIRTLTAALTGGVDVVLEGGQTSFHTDSDVVQMALVTALTTAAPIVIDTFDGTETIKRIEAFDVNPQSTLPGVITRVATQRDAATGVHHLELFVRQDGQNELQYIAIDAGIQRLCHAAAIAKQRLKVTVENTEITAVRLEPPPAALQNALPSRMA